MGWPALLYQLPCPECRNRARAGGMPFSLRIGHARARCVTCNNFNQAVFRLTRKRLVANHPREYAQIRYQVELDLYPAVLEAFVARERLDAKEPADGQR